MQIIVSREWLKACGMLDLEGVAMPAILDQSKSWSGMGNCFHVTLPNGTPWVVFQCRGVTIKM
jgi:hypothetical protein